MTPEDTDPQPHSRSPAKKPRRRVWLRWIAAFCLLVVIALLAAFYWRVPLANAVIEFGLGRAGVHNTKVTVTALSASKIHLADLRLGNAIGVQDIEAVIDLSRLPRNPVTRVIVDSLRADLADARRELEKMSPNRNEQDGADPDLGTSMPPPTIRSLLTRVADLPDVTVRNISLKYGEKKGIVTAIGSVRAARTDNNAYSVRLWMELSGQIDRTMHTVTIDGATNLTADTATIDIRAKANGDALAGAVEARADLSSDPAIFKATTQLETGDLATLAAFVPGLEAAGGSLKINARTLSSLAFGLDTPLGLPALTAALRKSGRDGIRFEAVLADASYGDRYSGIDGTVTAALRSLTDANDRLQADGNLSFRAARAGAADISVKNASVKGAYGLLRDKNTLTLFFPEGMRIAIAQVSSGNGAFSVAPVNVMLNTERARIHGFGQGGRPQIDTLLRMTLGATRLSLAGKATRRNLDLAALVLQLTGTVKALSSMDAPLIASGFDGRKRVGFAVIYPASGCSILFAAGPDGIRGSTPSQSIELEARTMPRVWPIPVTLFRHQIIFTLAIEFVARFVMRSSTPRFGTPRPG